MKIGITYDLRDDYLAEGFSKEETAEFDKSDTIDAIEDSLKKKGYETDRIGNAKQLIKRLAQGHRWDIVFNIAEGLYGFGREALVPALLDSYSIPYTFSNPIVLALTLHKGMTKRIIRDLKIPTPDFFVVETPDDIEKVNIPFTLFAKPVAEGTSKGISEQSIIKTRDELISVVQNLLIKFDQPVLVEKYLCGREFTVGIVGTGDKSRAIGAIEVLIVGKGEKDIYSYWNKANYKEIIEYKLATDETARKAMEIALAVWKGLYCCDAGRVDIRCNEMGEPNFIEVNPLAGLNPVDSDLPICCRLAGISYYELISMIMESAIQRVKVKV